MNRKSPTPLLSVFLSARFFGFSALAALLLLAPVARATDRTWNGGGDDNNWTTGANWGGTAPEADDPLFFGGTTRLTPSNDFAADTAFGGITFNAGAGAFSLSGNRITLGGNVTNNAANNQTIGLPMILDDIRTLNVSGAGSLTASGKLTGTGGLTKTGVGTFILGATTNTYTGITRISDGIFRVGAVDAFAGSSGKLIIEDGATFEMTQNQLATVTTFALDFGGTGYNGVGALYSTGSRYDNMKVTMTAPSLINTASGTLMFLTGVFDMNGHTLTKTGVGMLNIARKTMDNFGDIVVSQGELRLQTPTAINSVATRTITLKGSMLNVFASSLTYSMNISTENGSQIIGNSGAAGYPTLTGTITLEGSNTVGHHFTMTISGKITGSGGFVTHKTTSTTGLGTLILSGNVNDYQGNTTVSDKSILRVSNTSGSATGSGAVTVQSGGTLSGTGIIGGNLTVNAGGILSPADETSGTLIVATVGTLTVGGNVTLAQNAVLKVDFNATQSDLLSVGGTVTLPSAISLTLNNLDSSSPDSIALITAAGGFVGDPKAWDAVEINGTDYRFSVVGNTLQLAPLRLGTMILLR